jgi:hypothetical protein
MKKNIIFVSICFIIVSCNLNKNSNVFDSSKLIGRYKVDVSPYIAEQMENEEDEFGKIGIGLAGLAMTSIDLELSFYENKKGILHIDGGLIDFANVFSKDPLQKVTEFTYKVENDSILYIKKNKRADFKKWAIVRKYSENYDYLQFLIIEEGKDKVFFNLNKYNQ